MKNRKSFVVEVYHKVSFLNDSPQTFNGQQTINILTGKGYFISHPHIFGKVMYL